MRNFEGLIQNPANLVTPIGRFVPFPPGSPVNPVPFFQPLLQNGSVYAGPRALYFFRCPPATGGTQSPDKRVHPESGSKNP
jgi:hypothetical protein